MSYSRKWGGNMLAVKQGSRAIHSLDGISVKLVHFI
jgi:hypothetical protein